MQYLRAPSMLHDYHQMHSAIGGHLSPAGQQFEQLLPARIQLWLYRGALDRGHLDTILDRWIIDPLMQISSYLSRQERTTAFWTKRRLRRATAVSLDGPAGQRSDS